MRQLLFPHHSLNYAGVYHSGFGILGHWQVVPDTIILMKNIILVINIMRANYVGVDY